MCHLPRTYRWPRTETKSTESTRWEGKEGSSRCPWSSLTFLWTRIHSNGDGSENYSASTGEISSFTFKSQKENYLDNVSHHWCCRCFTMMLMWNAGEIRRLSMVCVQLSKRHQMYYKSSEKPTPKRTDTEFSRFQLNSLISSNWEFLCCYVSRWLCPFAW